MDLTEVEKAKLKDAVEIILKNGNELAKSNRTFIRWMTTSSLAIFAFFMTVMLQVRLEMDPPLKSVAIAAFVFLLCCILTGFYARLRFELKDWFSKITGVTMSSATLVETAVNQTEETDHLSDNERENAKQSLNEFTENIKLVETKLAKINPAKIMIIQMLLLTLSVCTISLYFFYYLFVF